MRRPAGGAFLALWVSMLCACGDAPADSSLKFACIVYGDTRKKQKTHEKLCWSMRATDPKVIVHTGDAVDHPDNVEEWKVFRQIVKDLREKTVFLAVRGDHDGDVGGPFDREFGIDRPWWDRRVGDVHYFLLQSSAFTDPDQMKWLEATAGASDALHKFAVFHHPPFSVDRDTAKQAPAIRELIHDRLVRLKFCAAFCGHNHGFYATARDGVRYIVTGGGGAPLQKQNEALAQPGDRFRMFNHYVGLIAEGRRISAKVVDVDGYAQDDLAFPVCDHP